MEEVKWIKLVVNARNSKSMKQLKSLPEGEKMALLWYEIMQLAGEVNERGFLYYDDDFPYTEEMLGVELGYDTKFIKYAFECLLKLKMISVIDNIYCLTNWNKYQNVKGLDEIRERRRLYMQEYRAKKQQKGCFLPEMCSDSKQGIAKIEKKGQNKPMAEVFKQYGNYGWVKLKASQYAKIKADYPNIDLDKQIELLDEYVQSNGNKNKYKDWNLVLRRSIRDKWFIQSKNDNGKKTTKLPDWYEKHLVDMEEKIKESNSKFDNLSLEDLLKNFKEK